MNKTTRVQELRPGGWSDRLRLPHPSEQPDQSQEWCEILEGGEWKRIRFHDYAEIFDRPGLYEHVFYELLRCDSPTRVVKLLDEVRRELERPLDQLRVIDFGAGNGIVAEVLRQRGVNAVMGVDIIESARKAALRDRPKLYQDYVVDDLCSPQEDTLARLRAFNPTGLICVAALGFGDIPPRAYFNALNLLPDGGLFAFNIKEEFLHERYRFGFSEMVRRMRADGSVRMEASMRYRHRIGITGEPLHYVAFVATKMRAIDEKVLVES